MIEAYTGTPGSGKSYHAARDIRDRFRWKNPVISNMEINVPENREKCFIYKDTFDLTPEFLISYSEELRKEKGWKRVPEDYIYLVIDEAQILFNCRDWNQNSRRSWITFFQMHRKLGYHIILITQMMKMLDKQVWGLCEYEILHRKLSACGWKGQLASLLFLSKTVFVSVRMWACLRVKIDAEFIRYNKKVASLYDTAMTYDIKK